MPSMGAMRPELRALRLARARKRLDEERGKKHYFLALDSCEPLGATTTSYPQPWPLFWIEMLLQKIVDPILIALFADEPTLYEEWLWRYTTPIHGSPRDWRRPRR